MEILLAPNPVLREECADIDIANEPDLIEMAEEMAKLMYAANGCGLAAPQVGIAKKFIVVDVEYGGPDGAPKNPIFLVNPYVESVRGEKVVDEEGCLSIPGVLVPVARCEDATVKALNLAGEEVTIEAKGFFARCLQHEIDHLSGRTLFETMPVMERLAKLEEYKAALAESGEVA